MIATIVMGLSLETWIAVHSIVMNVIVEVSLDD